MARQKGPLKIQGTIGDLSFIKTQDGFMVKEKSEISKSRIESDPMFQRTRENNQEFKSAAAAAKLIYSSVKQRLAVADRRMMSRLIKHTLAVVKTDAVHDRGQRTFADGTISMLEGFEINGNATFERSAVVRPEVSIDRVTGELELIIPAFEPAATLGAPSGADHYRFILLGAAMNFNELKATSAMEASEYLQITPAATTPLTLACNLPAATQDPIFLLAGIQFAQIVNGKQYPLKDGTHTALCIIEIDA